MDNFLKLRTKFRAAPALLIAIVGALFLCSFSLAADPSPTQAQKHLADIFYSDFRDVIEFQLEDSGLAPSDIDEIANAAADKYARCVVEALAEIDNPVAIEILDVLSQATSAQEIDEKLGDATDPKFVEFFDKYDAVMSPCRDAANAELGLPPQ